MLGEETALTWEGSGSVFKIAKMESAGASTVTGKERALQQLEAAMGVAMKAGIDNLEVQEAIERSALIYKNTSTLSLTLEPALNSNPCSYKPNKEKLCLSVLVQ